MSVVQLSRILHRRGKDENIDSVLLQEAELGFTTDSGRVFIGAPNYDPNIQRKNKDPHNVEILTELTQVASLTKYHYKYRDKNHSEFPTNQSERANSDYQLYLQEKLDQSVSICDYGALGDFNMSTGIGTDNTIAIRKAAVDTTSVDVGINRALYFPAGIYAISKPAVLPANSTWIGDGINKTVVIMIDPDAHCVARTIPSINFSSINEWDHNKLGIYEIPEFSQLFSNISNTSTRIENVTVHGITFIHLGFEMNAVTRQNPQEDLAVVKVEHCANIDFSNCSFEGNYKNVNLNQYENFVNSVTTVDPTIRTSWNNIGTSLFRSWQRSNMITTEGPEYNKILAAEKYLPRRDIIGVLIDSYANGSIHKSENINFISCVFSNTTYAFNITDDINNMVVENCLFNEHYRAVNLGENPQILNTNLTPVVLDRGSTSYNEGPKNVRIVYSHFRNIKDSAFYVARNVAVDHGDIIYYGHGSSYNIYDNVGFTDLNYGNVPNVSAIVFEDNTSGCSSLTDTFQYEGTVSTLRVKYSTNDSNIIINAYDGSYIPGANTFPGTGSQVNTTDGLTIENNRSTWTDFTPPIEFNTGLQNCIILEYSIKRNNDRFRMGFIKIISSGHADGTNWTEEIIETAPEPGLVSDSYGVGVRFRVFFNASGNTIRLQYKSSDLPAPGTGIFKYTSRFWDGNIS